MRAFLSPSRRFGLGSSGFVLVLVLAEFATAGSAHAIPGCSGAMDPSSCQFRFTNPTTTIGGGDSGDDYGAATAPTPSTASCPSSSPSLVSASSPASPCIYSDGVRQDHGVTDVLYNNFYPGATASSTTSCRFVDNTNVSASGGDLFVPQRSLNEFASFIAHAPGIAVAYCTQGAIYPYVATASYADGFKLWDDNGAITDTANAPFTGTTIFTLPTTRVPNVSPPQTANPISYTRQDCAHGTAGAALCRTRAIVETQTVTIAAAQNPDILDCTTPTLLNSIDCDWHWTAASRPVSSFTIDGVAYPSATADYDPPGSRPCGSEPNGAIWSSATAGLPSTGPCPPGYSGTQSCPTLIVNQYTCSAGASVLSNTGMQTGIVCTGCSLLPTSAPPPSACAAGGYAGDVVFVLDESASVIASDFLSAKTFFNDVVTGINLTSSSQVAVITFNTTPTQAGFGVRYQSPVLVGTNTSAINATLNKFVDTGGGTDIYTAMQTAANLLVGVGMTRTPKTIVLISDGQHNEAAPLPSGDESGTVADFSALAGAIQSEGIRIVTVGITDSNYFTRTGDDQFPPGQAVLGGLTAAESGTNAFTSTNYASLSAVESALEVALCAGAAAP